MRCRAETTLVLASNLMSFLARFDGFSRLPVSTLSGSEQTSGQNVENDAHDPTPTGRHNSLRCDATGAYSGDSGGTARKFRFKNGSGAAQLTSNAAGRPFIWETLDQMR